MDGGRLDLGAFPAIHLIGIGGVGVSAVARLLLARGIRVSGSDVRESALTKALGAAGARIAIGHRPDNLAGADLVVRSTAIPDTNPELAAAATAGIPVVHRSVVLDALMVGRRAIGVTGTNGKGSVSALIAWLLDAAGLSPSFAIGAVLLNWGTNAREGTGRHLVCELDESDGSFANTHPDRLVVNNVEADHLNYYKDLEGVLDTFARALSSPRAPAHLHANGDDPNVAEVLRRAGRGAVTFGVAHGTTYRLAAVEAAGTRSMFRLEGPRGDLGWFELPLPGEYNVMNAAAALSVVLEEGVPAEQVRTALPAYLGLENRFTLRRAGDCLVVKDYISHPTGIRSVIAGARAFAPGRIVAVFKPYRFTMIHYLQNEYRDAFTGADVTLLTEMYTAGEVPIPGVDTEWLAAKIRSAGSEVAYVHEMNGIPAALRERLRPGDTVVFFGGDDLFGVADRFAADLDGGGGTGSGGPS
jgi:UDP-N-acetylmuramate--alanine ligase